MTDMYMLGNNIDIVITITLHLLHLGKSKQHQRQIILIFSAHPFDLLCA